MSKLLHRLLLTAMPLLAACATIPADTDPAPGDTAVISATEPSTSAQPAEPIEYGSFSREQLEIALLSEFGGIRGYMPQATQGYYQLAQDTRDPQIVRRALEFASAMGEQQMIAELAALWIELDPAALDPNLIMGYQLLDQGLYVRALVYLDNVLSLGGAVDFTALSARTYTLENRQRDVIAEQLINILDRFPQEPSVYYALAQMYDQNGDNPRAADMLALARNEFGDNPRTALIEAQLLQNLGRADDAEQILADAVIRYPQHRVLRYSYAQTLVQNDKLEEAVTQFHELVRQDPEDFETLYSLALINLELDELLVAETQMRVLLQARHRVNEARFYLGYILEARSEPADALNFYQQINRQSNAYLSAQRQIMRLFVELERFDEARAWTAQSGNGDPGLGAVLPALEAEALLNGGHDERASEVLNQAVDRFPDNTDLLFARTLLAERRDDLTGIEQDLRQIIQLNPDDARALNHLGYALTIRSTRYEEALTLIERAIALNPDDPAIIDSLGWVQYKLGDYESAMQNLRRAYAAYPDHEVAAHLGEVLWVMGREQEAMAIWQEALEQIPDSEHVLEAMQRLTPEK